MDKREFNLSNSVEDSMVEDIRVEEDLTDDGVGHAYLDCNEFNEDGNTNDYSCDGWYMDGWGDSRTRYQDDDDFYMFLFKSGLVLGSLGTMIALGLWKLITKNKGKKGGRSLGK